MGLIKGIPVTLYERTQTGEDDFGAPIFEEMPVTVEDVLVAPAQIPEIITATNLVGSKAVYKIAIPKGDSHAWQNRRVDFFGESWRVIGEPMRGISELLPLGWGDIWEVERYGNTDKGGA